MRKREFLGAALSASLASTAVARAQGRKLPSTGGAKRPNVLIVTVDDMDISMPGYMGNRHGLTPSLDALAARSHVFAACRGASPICMPSRQAFMSGLLPHRNGPGGFDPMNEGTASLCSILAKAGYYTAASHKIEHMQPRSSFPWDTVAGGNDRNTLSHAAAFKQAIAAAKAEGAPWFINCNINDPHRPFYGSPGGLQRDNDNAGAFRLLRPERKPADVVVPPFLEDLPDVRLELSQYWNSVQRMDQAIGELMKAFDESGARNDTVVVFCNDHGMPFPFSKATGYDSGTRVPALVSYPGMSAPKRHDDLTCNVDIMPTVLELVGLPVPQGLDGHSWVSKMQGQRGHEREFVVTEVNGVANGSLFPARTIQDGRYSLIYQIWSNGERRITVDSLSGLTWRAMNEAGQRDPRIAERARQAAHGVPISFFDRQADPGQRRNLIDDPQHAQRIARLREALLAEMERTRDPQLANVRTMIAGGTPTLGQGTRRAGGEDGGVAPEAGTMPAEARPRRRRGRRRRRADAAGDEG